VTVVGVMAALGTSKPVAAQDAHYWTFQHGPRAALLGGAIIGSVSDIGATFYNPGALALADSLAFAFVVNLLEVENTTLKDAAGTGIDLGSTFAGPIPNILAGKISSGSDGNNVITYSIITRQRGRTDAIARVLLAEETIPPDRQLSDFFGRARVESSFSEWWAGLSWARSIGPRIGVGATWYLAARSQRNATTLAGEALDVAGGGLVDVRFRDFEYFNVRTLWKGGLFIDYPRITAGLTVTTPGIRLGGGGKATSENLLIGQDEDGDGRPDTEFAAALQKDLASTYRTPLSVGLGGAWRFTSTTRLHASTEWYDAVGRYDVLDTGGFEAQGSGKQVPFEVIDARTTVWNYAIGLEHEFSPKFKGYGSWSTDNSGRPDDAFATDLSITNWGVRLLSVGADLRIGQRSLTLGIGYGWGGSTSQQLVDFLEATAGDLLGEPTSAPFRYRTVRLIKPADNRLPGRSNGARYCPATAYSRSTYAFSTSANPATVEPSAGWITMYSLGACAPEPWPSPENTSGSPSRSVNW
jgi:hypothetical protein